MIIRFILSNYTHSHTPQYTYIHNIECRKVAEAIAKSTGKKGTSLHCFMNLPSHNRFVQCFPDAMHTVKDAIARVFFLLIRKTNLDKISVLNFPAVNVNMVDCQIRTLISHTFHHQRMQAANERSKMIIMTSKNIDPGSIFFRTTGLRSHHWKYVHSCMH